MDNVETGGGQFPARPAISRVVALLGTVNLLALLCGSVLSWLLAPFATYEERTYGQFEFFARVADALPWPQSDPIRGMTLVPAGIQASLRARGPLESRTLFLETYAAPLVVSSVVAVLLLALLWSRRSQLTSRTADQLAAWAPAFALGCVLAVPVLVPDFWLSLAWGRTLAAGFNPYYQVPASAVSWLPLDAPIMRMTYGPLWAYVAGGLMWLVRGHALWGALAFKVVLAAAWVLVVRVVRDLVRARSPLEQCVAVVMTAWLPISVVQTVAEGHNDVVMVLGALLWMRWLARGQRYAATAALTASVLFKYASAPLFLIDLLYRAPHESRSVVRHARQYAPYAALAGVMAVMVFAPVFRGLDFFSSTADVHGGHFFLPSDAVFAIGDLLGVSLRPLAYVVMGCIPLVTLRFVYRFVRDGGGDRVPEAATAVMFSMLLVGSSHAWPWYVLWLIAPAATVARSAIGRFATGLALAMPFPLLVWTVSPFARDFKKFFLPSLLAYGLALAWTLATARMARQLRSEG